MPEQPYEIHPGELPPRRGRPPNARMRALIEGNILKYPSRVATSGVALARHGYRLRSRTAQDGFYVWAEPMAREARSKPNPKTRRREKRKA